MTTLFSSFQALTNSPDNHAVFNMTLLYIYVSVITFTDPVPVRASVKLFELGVRTPGGLILDVRYAGGVHFRRFRTPSLPIFGVILRLLETTKM